MRPPQNAGESVAGDFRGRFERVASMRPPQNAGESPLRGDTGRGRLAGFNEAPAERGGKSRPRPPRAVDGGASMRPPQNAGESKSTNEVQTVEDALQ